MADTEISRVGRAYRVCTDANLNEWQRYSFWTTASDVELDDGRSVQTLFDLLQPNSFGSVLNAVNAEQALNSKFSELSDEAVEAGTAIDVTFVGDALLDKIVEIQGTELVTVTIRAPVSEEDDSVVEEIVDPYISDRETPASISTEIQVGDSMAVTMGKIKKKLADLSEQIAEIEAGGGGGGTPSPTPTPGGTTNYNDLTNKPSINGVTLQGNLLLSALMDESSAVPEIDISIMVEEAFAD